jgi:gliding motility-associated-like protein
LEGITGTWSPATISNTASANYIFTPNSGQCATATAEISVVVNSDIKKTTEYVKCNNDIDLKINLSSLLPAETPTGGTWSEIVIPGDIGRLKDDIFFPFGIKTGDHLIKYIVPVGNCFKTVEITIIVDNDCVVEAACNFFIHNAFSPNNDGLNEFFEIENINRTDCFPTNNVEIYNRWGVLVFEVDQYDNNTRVFKGNSEGRSTVDKSVELPSGTYFYIIQYTSSDGILNKKDGYLYLTR